MPARVQRIEPHFVERVWGSFDLQPLFEPRERRIGEVWFDAGPLLIKFLFTTEALSVQVHPDDAYAQAHEGSAGKTEMWHILRAEPHARIALGFQEPVSLEQALRAAEEGTIEGLLGWYEARAEDTYLTPARTVHALGAGLVVCEIQQTSDVTYRLYDYGRRRELHLDKGFAVADLGSHPGKSQPEPLTGGVERLASCEYFVTERWEVSVRAPWPGGILIAIEGSGELDGQHFGAGEVWIVDNGVELKPEGRLVVLRTYEP